MSKLAQRPCSDPTIKAQILWANCQRLDRWPTDSKHRFTFGLQICRQSCWQNSPPLPPHHLPPSPFTCPCLQCRDATCCKKYNCICHRHRPSCLASPVIQWAKKEKWTAFTYWPCSQYGHFLTRSYACPSACMYCTEQNLCENSITCFAECVFVLNIWDMSRLTLPASHAAAALKPSVMTRMQLIVCCRNMQAL